MPIRKEHEKIVFILDHLSNELQKYMEQHVFLNRVVKNTTSYVELEVSDNTKKYYNEQYILATYDINTVDFVGKYLINELSEAAGMHDVSIRSPITVKQVEDHFVVSFRAAILD